MKQSKNVHRKKLFLGLVRRYPVASVVGLWMTLLFLAGLSTAALMNVNHSQTTQTTQISATEPSTSLLTQPATVEQPKQVLPWLSFGAIALSCTLGCLMLSQSFRSAGYQPVQRKPFKARSFTPLKSAEADRQDAPVAAERSQPNESSSTPFATSVTVVPTQQNHPLDWDEPSLADSLDMRQRRPLSHWL
ncbi:MAG: hypothetical protein KME11_00505 [Timaviella obliquedivisa GSE-PSE-MK23-08B]|jgi:hypothetical protein|nr:hypothetical protein [Timaviella obliquedivisa GSE-PSE-MK23-08B]